MVPADSAQYLREFARALMPGGRAFLTCFVEESVPDFSENPTDYGAVKWKGRLHCARYKRSFFEGLVANSTLRVWEFEYGRETDGQSLYVLENPRK